MFIKNRLQKKERIMNTSKLLIALAAICLSSMPALADNHQNHERPHKGKMFERLDTDGNGTITENEFLDAHTKRFNTIDTDGDGEISKTEAQAHSQARRAKMKERAQERREDRRERRGEE